MRQRRLEHLICSKFYFSNNHKRYPVPLQLNLLDHARCKHEVPKEKKKSFPTIVIYTEMHTQNLLPVANPELSFLPAFCCFNTR